MKQVITLALPFPPKECSPNSRAPWQVKASKAKEYRHACKVLALNERNTTTGFYPLPAPVDMKVVFVLKDKKRRDWDNLIAAFKPGLDGIVDAGLIEDDSVWVLRRPVFMATTMGSGAGIYVTLESDQADE